MIKEILEAEQTEALDGDALFKSAMKNMEAINKMIDKAIKDKDQKKLDSIAKNLAKIKK